MSVAAPEQGDTFLRKFMQLLNNIIFEIFKCTLAIHGYFVG